MTTVRRCTCTHEQQDRMYGSQQRVMNQTTKGKDIKTYRCTVCNKEH